MRTVMRYLVVGVMNMTLSGCAGWVVFGHTIGSQQPVGAAPTPPASTAPAPRTAPHSAPPLAAAQPCPATDHPCASQPASWPQPAATPGALVLKAVTVTFTPAARDRIAAEPRFTQDGLLAAIEADLRAHKLLDDSDPRASGTLKISIDGFATRPLSNAVVFGYLLGNGTLTGNIEVHATEGKDLPDARIKAESRVDKPVSDGQANPYGPLYRRFADLTVDTLNRAFD
jgi:hypothetical protein